MYSTVETVHVQIKGAVGEQEEQGLAVQWMPEKSDIGVGVEDVQMIQGGPFALQRVHVPFDHAAKIEESRDGPRERSVAKNF